MHWVTKADHQFDGWSVLHYESATVKQSKTIRNPSLNSSLETQGAIFSFKLSLKAHKVPAQRNSFVSLTVNYFLSSKRRRRRRLWSHTHEDLSGTFSGTILHWTHNRIHYPHALRYFSFSRYQNFIQRTFLYSIIIIITYIYVYAMSTAIFFFLIIL